MEIIYILEFEDCLVNDKYRLIKGSVFILIYVFIDLSI